MHSTMEPIYLGLQFHWFCYQEDGVVKGTEAHIIWVRTNVTRGRYHATSGQLSLRSDRHIGVSSRSHYNEFT